MAKRSKNNPNIISIFLMIILAACYIYGTYINKPEKNIIKVSYDKESIPEYSGDSYVYLNENKPYFEEYTTDEFEIYSDLDDLNRCGTAYANISEYTMPTEKRGDIGSVKPSGWQVKKYDSIDGKYLYNRCHLIGYQLAGENANPKNLITCTREMNARTMLEFENKVASYVRDTGNHVMYRVTPVFENNNLIAKGVIMEAYSVEDEGEGVEFNVFVYNVQRGIIINYETGDSHLEG